MNYNNMNDLVNHKDLHLEDQFWFDHLQDCASLMFDDCVQGRGCEENYEEGWFFYDCFCRYISEVTDKYYTILQKHQDIVPKLPKNKLESVKLITYQWMHISLV